MVSAFLYYKKTVHLERFTFLFHRNFCYLNTNLFQDFERVQRKFSMVHQEGFEPPTFRFVAEHFIQLSYWCILLYYTCFFCILQEIFNILVEVFLCFRVNNNFFLKTFRKFIKCLANLSFLCYIILVIWFIEV